MDHVYFTTTKHEKGKHLSYDERVLIQIRLKDGGQLTKSLKKSAVLQTPFVMRCAEVLSSCIEAMLSVTRQRQYQQNRIACGRHLDNLEKAAFLAYVDSHIASISVKCSRSSRQTMVLSFRGYLNLKNQPRLSFFIHIHIRHVKKELMNVIMALYKDLFQKVNVSVTLM